MKSTQDMIAPAITWVGDPQNGLVKNGRIPNAYKGYVSSFATTVNQCGLMPAVALFSSTTSKSDSEKFPVLDAVFSLIKEELWKEVTLLDRLLTLSRSTEATRRQELELLEEQVLEAAVALKLAIRTFKFE